MDGKCYINPDIFIDLSQPEINVWNYKTNKNHELSDDEVLRLLQIKKSNLFIADDINDNLLKLGLISLRPFSEIEWHFDIFSKIFHFGTKNNDREEPVIVTMEDFTESYVFNSSMVWFKLPPPILPERMDSLPIVELPASTHQLTLDKSLWNALSKRKSSRDFNGEAITLEQLSTVLYTVFSPQEDSDEFINQFLTETLRFKRTSPSAGSFHPSMPYIVALNVTGLEPGIYFYDFIHHQLRLILKANLKDKMGYICCDQIFANQLSAGIFMTTRFDRVWHKYYISRAYRFSLLEMGHLAQNILLCATTLGINTWITAAFRDAIIEELLNVDGENEQVMYFVGLGRGSNNTLDPLTLETWKQEFNNKEKKA